MSIRDIVIKYNPDFDNVSELDFFIQNNKPIVNSKTYGTKYNLAVALLTSHELTLLYPNGVDGGSDGSSTNIKSKKEGDLKIEYKRNLDGDNLSLYDYYRQTIYGSKYWALKKTCTLTARNRFV